MATERAFDPEKQLHQQLPQDGALSRVVLVPFSQRAVEIIKTYTKFGYTAFGGPAVHVALLHDEVVTKLHWVSNEQFTELFAICQALPGPASTELAFSIALVRNGFAVPGFLVMTVAGALIGIVGETIPLWAERLEQGLASAAIGLVALAAYRMSTTLATDKLTRILALVSGGVTALYSSAWLLPVVMAAGGLCSLAFDALWTPFMARHRRESQSLLENKGDLQQDTDKSEPVTESVAPSGDNIEPEKQEEPTSEEPSQEPSASAIDSGEEDVASSAAFQTPTLYNYSPKLAFGFLAVFSALLIASIVVRATIPVPPKADYGYLLATFYFVGSIIFGGGPVIIPLLRTYMVEPQWMSDSQFLVGLALIQALPGPNFNLAAFLGAVAMMNTTSGSVGASILGAFLCYVAIFTPGLLLKCAILPLWQALRDRPAVKMVFRGVNAAALGLVFSAVWLLWVQITTLQGSDGYHIVIASAGFVASGYLGVPAPLVIVLGGAMGAIEYAVETS
ncbi:hypothetical protein DFQ27_008576 [Actinomortierella ambigua]|uniref:Chromate transporter n=1 Tax=Actinomortierella ambigua TaxID=1343610 RepID=A0A9P6TXR0_9FUNG|nr:hypothetical protein DFQ27_008576 [Actinomortierella ambigua]